MFVVDLSTKPDPKTEIARLLGGQAGEAKKSRKAIEKHNVEAEIAAWAARTAKAVKKRPPADKFPHLCFAIVHCPVASDPDGFYAELIVGSDSRHDPLEDGDSSYAEYDPSELKNDHYTHHVPFLTTVALELMEKNNTEEAQGELEMAFAAMCVDRLLRSEAPLLLGGRESRRIFLGWNEASDLLGVVTKEGWKPKPLEADATEWLAEMGA